jgi:hypothetical protein
MPDSEMTDTTNEDKEIERIARIAMMSSLLARAMHAETERDRMKDERDRMEDALRDIVLQCNGYEGRANIAATALSALKETDHD